MKKIKLVISDFHLCEGRILPDGTLNVMEDFVEDRRFCDFLHHYSSGDYRENAVELVINGDFLNLIQIPLQGRHVQVITEHVTLEKIKTIIEGHGKVFEALKIFNACPHHSIVYIVGNHDLEMMWPGARKAFFDQVGGSVSFYNTTYIDHGVHIEHGHQLEATNKVDVRKLFISDDVPEPILNLPWGSHFLINVLLKIKRRRPIIDSVRPFRAYVFYCLFTDFLFGMWMAYQIVFYFIKTRFVKDTQYSRMMTTFQVIKDMSLVPDIDRSAMKILKRHEGIHTVVFGHSHLCRYRTVGRDKVYINTGTWNEVTSLDLDTLGRMLKCSYAYIEMDLEQPDRLPLRQLKQWHGHWVPDEEAYG